MPINFPKHHIAESVTNRILNVWDDLRANDAAAAAAPAPPSPSTPDAIGMQGAQLDSALATPPPADMDGAIAAPTAGSVMAGEPPIEGIL